MPILYINPLGQEITLILIDGSHIIEVWHCQKNINASSTFPRQLLSIVDTHSPTEIWTINGPGPFTLMRIITLSINALKLTRYLSIRSVDLGELIDTKNTTPIMEINGDECLIWRDNTIEEVKKRDLPSGSYTGYFSGYETYPQVDFHSYVDDITSLSVVFQDKKPVDRISPLYFKAPHITCPK